MSEGILPVCISVYHVHAVLLEAGTGHWIHRDWSYRQT